MRAVCGGIGSDIALEIAGFNFSVNNALQSTRRGGDVILLGLKQGYFHIQALDRVIVNGLSLPGGGVRRIFETWYTRRNRRADRANGIRDGTAEVILGGGGRRVRS